MTRRFALAPVLALWFCTLTAPWATAEPYNLDIESVEAPAVLQRGQQAVPVTVTLRNTGDVRLPSRPAVIAFGLAPAHSSLAPIPFAVLPLPSIPAGRSERVTLRLDVPSESAAMGAARLEARVRPQGGTWQPTQDGWNAVVRVVEPAGPTATPAALGVPVEASHLGVTRPRIAFSVKASRREPAALALVGADMAKAKTANLPAVLKSATTAEATADETATAKTTVAPGRTMYEGITADFQCRLQTADAQPALVSAVHVRLQLSFGLPPDAPHQDIHFLVQLKDIRLEGARLESLAEAEVAVRGLDTGTLARVEAGELKEGLSRRIAGRLSGLTMTQSARTIKELALTARLRAKDCPPQTEARLAGRVSVVFDTRPVIRPATSARQRPSRTAEQSPQDR
ncbi:MAG: hypothetical protein FJ278_02785 [Planctomycetes bacterium]|nr:hypothetical protein [Planctomycetota bacterium]